MKTPRFLSIITTPTPVDHFNYSFPSGDDRDEYLLPTDDEWFGVTYKEDKAAVVESFRGLYERGVYGAELYGDLR